MRKVTEMSQKLAAYAVVAVAMSTALATGAAAGASGGGRLDPSFGDGGRSVVSGIWECLPLEGGCLGGIGMALQRDGAIVVAGGTSDADCGSRFALARLLKSGRPDPAFGDGGRVVTAFGSSSAVAHAGVVMPDNRIVIGGVLVHTEAPCAGFALDDREGKGFALARYLPDGTLDPSFGDDGRVVTHFDHGAGLVLLLQRNGKVVVVGVSKGHLALARYASDGSLDPSFGQQGIVTGRFSWDEDLPGKAKLDKFGRILVPVSGNCYECPAYVVRYKADGRLDSTFGRRGRAAVAFPSIDSLATFRGQIVIAGAVIRNRLRLAVSRLSSTGKLDRRFGRHGTRLLPVWWGWRPVITIDRSGAILVAAAVRGDAEGFDDFDFTLTRILSNGAVDRSFGGQGTVTADFGGADFGQAIAVQRDGKLLIAGVIGRADGIGLARYLP
jgi:uncharacterized delta-60 repeat protein